MFTERLQNVGGVGRRSGVFAVGQPSLSRTSIPSGSNLRNSISIITNPVRSGENPMWLRGIVFASKAVTVPMMGFCALGLASPIINGVTLTSSLTAATCGSLLFQLIHEMGYMNDVSKSMKISRSYPFKGTWSAIPQNRLNPAITITSFPENSTLVEGSVASAVRAVSYFGNGRVFMIDDSKSLCNRFGKQHLAAEWDTRVSARDRIMAYIVGITASDQNGPYDNVVLNELISGQGMARSDAIAQAKILYAEQRARDIADCICLGYEMELEASARQVCERFGFSRATETRLTNEFGVLKTIKQIIEEENIESIVNASQRQRALKEVIDKICRTNLMRAKDVDRILDKWMHDKTHFLYPERERLLSIGFRDSRQSGAHDTLRKRISSEIRRQEIAILGAKMIDGHACQQEAERIACLISEEYPQMAHLSKGLAEWITLNFHRTEPGHNLAFENGPIYERAYDMMLHEYFEEDRASFKERIRMMCEDDFGLSNAEAEEASIEITAAICPQCQGDEISDSDIFSYLFMSSGEQLSSLIQNCISPEQRARGLHVRLASKTMREADAVRLNVSRSAKEIIRWLADEMAMMTKIASDIGMLADDKRAEEVLDHYPCIAEECLPVLKSFVLIATERGFSNAKIGSELAAAVPAIAALSVSESHRLINYSDILGPLCARLDGDARTLINRSLVSFAEDWPNTGIRGDNIGSVANQLSSTVRKGLSIRDALAEALGLPQRFEYYLAARIEKSLNDRLLDIRRFDEINSLVIGRRILQDKLSSIFGLCRDLSEHPVAESERFDEHSCGAASGDKIVAYFHRDENIGGKAGALGDATAGYGIESRIKNLISLAIETRMNEIKTGCLDIHAIPSVITAIDRNICQKFRLPIDPAGLAKDLIVGIQQGKNRKALARELSEQLGCPNLSMRRRLVKVMGMFPHNVDARNTADIMEQIIAQMRLPDAVDISGRKAYLSSALTAVAPMIDGILSRKQETQPMSVEGVLDELRSITEHILHKPSEKDKGTWPFIAKCLNAPLPEIGPKYDVIVQFDGGRHINRDYLFENVAYYLAHPTLFLVQTRQHYGRNRWSHPVLIGADSWNDVFYEHMNFAKTLDNAVFPCGSGLVLPRHAWLWGGEWQDEIEYSRAVDSRGRLTGKVSGMIGKMLGGSEQ